ncbi:OLC1v1032278C1 [Oldenlandia corymbosa var. corymbosa]|uniref:OLC1v1032278C1 n=1 Tax=Oldenlandia corymbosa var. corymbosa TaxID=529605 RepID=A0AAV1CNT4_OLDCO|nr:OLC1v1032278C1 [Oldenlandia corymbosa var. corymbosa]
MMSGNINKSSHKKLLKKKLLLNCIVKFLKIRYDFLEFFIVEVHYKKSVGLHVLINMGHRLTVNQLRIKSQHKVTTWDRLMAKRGCLDQWITVAVMLLVDFAFAVVNVLYKKALNDGMSNLLLIFYRQCVSAIFLAPIAYIWERKSWENLTVGIVCGLFLSALLGATLCQYFFLIGLGYTSATYTCAFINVVPVVTFILALWLRQEKLNLKNRSGRAKLLGAIVCVGGVLLLILYKGVAVINAIKTAAVTTQSDKKRAKDWVVGSIFLFVGSTMWSSWFVIQAQIGKYFAFQYSSTTIISFFATIQSAILCLIVDRNMSSWLPKGITQITTVIYAVSNSSRWYLFVCLSLEKWFRSMLLNVLRKGEIVVNAFRELWDQVFATSPWRGVSRKEEQFSPPPLAPSYKSLLPSLMSSYFMNR